VPGVAFFSHGMIHLAAIPVYMITSGVTLVWYDEGEMSEVKAHFLVSMGLFSMAILPGELHHCWQDN